MQAQLEFLRTYAGKAWKYRYLALAVAFVTALAGWAYVLRLPDIYQSSAQIYVDPKSTLDALLKDIAVDSSSIEQDFIRIARQTLLSRANVMDIARAADLDVDAVTDAGVDRLIQGIRKDLRIAEAGAGNRGPLQELVISYEHSSPEKAYAVARAALNRFIDSVVGASQADAARGAEFLDSQIAEYKRRLEQAELELQQFKSEHMGVMPGTGSSYFARLQSVRDKVAETGLQLREAERRRDALQAQMQAVANGTGGGDRYAERIARLRDQLDELRLRLTDQHPDVIYAQSQLEDLLEAQRRQGGPAPSVSPMASEIAAAEFRVELSRAAADVASLQARLDEFSRRQAELESAVNTIPEVEAEMQQLNRNYDIYRRQHDQLVQRREQIRLSQEAELTSDSGELGVIEPPRIPTEPVRPDRLVLHMNVLLVAIGAGFAAAGLLVVMRPDFSTTRELANATSLPVLGSIGMVTGTDDAPSAFTGLATVTVGLAGLLAMFGGVIYLDVFSTASLW